MTTIKLGKLSIDAIEYGSQGNAILGIRDSGKTYTATYFAECLFDAGIPFITFDPIGVWRFLRVPGRGKGYPIVVAGGKEGDLPLTEAGAPEIVRAAMRNGVSLVIDLFDMSISKSAWRRIVTNCVKILLHENQSHGLRHVFIEEAAEFVPQSVRDGDVYDQIERLARMGGNARLGYTLINQRSQEVNKAVLELCTNVFLHRQQGKNALDNLKKWFDVAAVTEREAIVQSLFTLPQGQCWAWVGGDTPQPPTLVKVPAKDSLHPDRRVMRGDQVASARAPIDVSKFVAGMKGSLAKIEEEDNANNPKLLRGQIAALKAEKAKLERHIADFGKQPQKADPDAITKAEQRGFERRQKAMDAAADKALKVSTLAYLEKLRELIAPLATVVDDEIKRVKREQLSVQRPEFTPSPVSPAAITGSPRPLLVTAPPRPPRATPSAEAGGDGIRPLGAERKPLTALAAVHPAGMTEAQWAVAAGLKRSGGTWGTYVSRLRTAGRIVEQAGEFFITDEGLNDLGGAVQSLPPPGMELVQFWCTRVKSAAPMLRTLAEQYPAWTTREALATELNLAEGGGTFGTYLSRLRSPGLIEEAPDKVHLRAAPMLMEGRIAA